MVKKLLFLPILIFLFLLIPTEMVGQECSVPARPGTITNTDEAPVCPGEEIIFSIDRVTNVDSNGYTWTVPTGWSIISGQGSLSIGVRAGSAGQNGNVEVTATNSCGTSDPQVLSVTVAAGTPNTPGNITSNDEAPVCPGDEITFSISSVTNVDPNGYVWTVPTGWSITGGQGSTSITATAGSTGQNGNIQVTASNSCGTSDPQSLSVTVVPDVPNTPGTISSNDEAPVCPGDEITFSISSVTNADSNGYTWTVPTGWSITGGQGSTSITATAGSAGQDGNIQVTASNSCGTSDPKSLSVTVVPDVPNIPGTISSNDEAPVCPGDEITFSISSVTNADSNGYTWTVPTGWSITGGQGSTSITATAGSAGQNGNIQVTASNSCGTSEPQVLAVEVQPGKPAKPGSITGSTVVCPAENVTYAITSVTNADTYNWTVPTGWRIISGGDTSSITVEAGDENQNGPITVTAQNSCGISEAQQIDVIAIDPSVSINAQGPTTICSFESVAFNVSAFNNGGAASYTYEWQKYAGGSWVNVGTGTSITTGTTGTSITFDGGTEIANGNKVRLHVNFCDDFSIASNEFTVTVNNERIPEVEVSASSSEICAGEQVTFTASPMNGGTNPQYVWYVGGIEQTGESGAQFSTTLDATSTVSVELISNTSCVDPSKAYPSDEIGITVNPLLVPEVEIQNTSPTEICAGEAISFSVSHTLNGGNPVYRWFINGGTAVHTGSSFTTTALKNGDEVYVEMTSDVECVDPDSNPAISGRIPIIVHPIETPTVSISSNDPDNIICTGTPVTFGIDQQGNAGDSPTYNWYINDGDPVSTGATFTTSGLNNGDEIYVVMTPGNDICFDEAATSEPITMTVNPYLNPSVSIESDKTVICAGSTVNFTSTLTDGGTNPQYQWYVNGQPKGTQDSYRPSDLPVGKNVEVYLQVTILDECVTDNENVVTTEIINVEVVGSKPATPGTITGSTAICPIAENLVYSVEEVTGAISYEWTIPSGWTFDGANNTASVTLRATNNSVRGVQYVKVRAKNICGDSEWQQLEIEIQDFVEVQAGEDVVVCQDAATVALSGSATFGNGQGQASKLNPTWKIVSGSGTLSNATNLANASYTPGATDGPNSPVTLSIVTDQPKGACQAGYDEIIISFYENATVESISESFAVCQGQGIALSGTLGGSADTATWTASPSTSGSFDNINSLNPVFTPNTDFIGDITFTLTATGPCSPDASETVIVTVEESSTVNAGEDFSICSGETISLSGSFTGSSETGVQWTTNGDGSFGDLNSETSTYIPGTNDIANGSVTLTLTTTNSPDTCGEIYDEVTLAVYEQPEVTISPESAEICEDETYEVSADISGDTAEGLWSTSGDGSFSNSTSLTSIYTPGSADISNGDVILTYTVQADNANCQEASSSIALTVQPLPVITFDENWNNSILCSNSTIVLDGATISGPVSRGKWEIISGGGSLSDNTMTTEYQDVVYTPDSNKNSEVVLRLSTEDPEGNCSAATFDLNISARLEPRITTQPSNVGVCSTQPSELTVVATGNDLRYEWYKNGELVGPNSSTLSFTNTTSSDVGEYYVMVYSDDSCQPAISETVTINVDEDIVIEAPVRDVPVCSDGFSSATFEFIAHANGAELSFTWLKDGQELDIAADPHLTFDGPERDTEGVYTGSLTISGISNEEIDAYTGDYQVFIEGPEGFSCSTAISNVFYLRVNRFPDPPLVADEITFCQGDPADLNSFVEGTNIKWYSEETGGDYFVDSGDFAIPPPSFSTETAGTYSYWVTQSPDVCESDRTLVTITVKPTPAAPTPPASVQFCIGSEATALNAGAQGDAPVLWYSSADAETPLEVGAEGLIPATEELGTTSYWVSQILDGCESGRAKINVIINDLPTVAISVPDGTALSEGNLPVICQNSSIILTASGATTYVWQWEDEVGVHEEVGETLTVGPSVTTTYTVTGTDNNNCEGTAEITVNVDAPTVAGTITGPESVCISSPNGTFNLTGYTGDIQRWESSEDGGANWTEIANTSETLEFTDLNTTTIFRAVVKNGVCDELPTNEIEVTIDPLPVGGELAFVGNGRVFTICENPVGNYAVDLNLTGKVGKVVRWGYRSWDATTYTDLMIGGELFTGTTLTAAQIQSLGFSETTVFQVEVRSGVCSPDALSKTAILSVIPSDITPSPVTVDPGVVCLGEEVTLSSETGYQTGGTILDQGAFDNASITSHGWRIRREGISGDIGFDTDANNTEFDRWKRATPRAFTTASINSPYNTSGVVFDTGIEDGNKGFALISGDYRSTMETPVFTIGSMDQAVLTFDQAYVLTPGASLKVEISTDGGSSYTTLYVREVPADATQGIQSGNFGSFGTGTVDSHPENKILVDLGDYMGRPNLRIRFNYSGARPGDIWAVDNIDVPEGPNGITMEWRDYTDPNNPEGVLIGNDNVEKWTPTQVGLNVFEVKTKLVYNSNGDACEVAENAQRVEVFVFDEYTSTVEADYGSCGNLNAQLSATVTNAAGTTITSFPTPDGYLGEWKIEGTSYELLDPDPDNGIAAINEPNAILAASESSSFKASFILKPTLKKEDGTLYENNNCRPVTPPTDIVLSPCTTLDFDGTDDYVDLGEGYTGDYSIEAWIRPEASTGTVISTPNLEINMGDLTGITANTRWYHIAVDSDGKLYIDGIDVERTISATGSDRAFIGARWNASNAENHFSGWIEEVRIWNGKIEQDQIQFLMNQRLQNAANIGVEIPMPAPGLSYTGLAGYYQLLADNILNGGYTPDISGSPVNGKLRNMETLQENTAPLPYTTSRDNFLWTDEGEAGPWTHWDVWDIPHSNGINNTPITWNIVRTSNYLESGNKDIIVLGLIVESNELDILNPSGAHNETNSGQSLEVTHYLNLDGVIDLTGESQLLQPEGSIIDSGSTGYLERDQQGTASSYNYNYWSPPVSIGTGNVPYTIDGVMKDGTGTTPQDITFGAEYHFADGAFTTPRRVSSYWLHIFHGTATDYGSWVDVTTNTGINVGEGYSMKGTSGNAAITDPQNYTFKGMPNNGNVNLSIGKNQSYLIGNPYPSAIDADQFIRDHLKLGGNTNNVFNGTLYFWDHFSGKTHYLEEYIGGYAMFNLAGSVVAVSIDERINHNEDKGQKRPGQYVPVGQAFFVNTLGNDTISDSAVDGGNIIFKNEYRVYQREHAGPEPGESVFHSQENKYKTQVEGQEQQRTATSDERLKIWLKYKSPKGYHRQLLVTADPNASKDFDLGYDAPLIDNNVEDMYWYFNNHEFVIQGVDHLNKDQELPLGVKVKDEGVISISIDELRNVPEDMEIYIKDSLDSSYHDLREGEFKTTAGPGTANDRLKLVFSKPAPEIEEPPVDEIVEGDLEILYVNGTREILVRNPQLYEISRIYLNNILGQQVMVYYDVPEQAETPLPVRRFAAGVYIVKAHTEKGIITKKVILE